MLEPKNNSTSDTTHTSLFFANYRFYLKIRFELQVPPTNIEAKAFEEFIKHIEELKSNFKAEIQLA